uniref:Uncharacterized protein n=1 Tax=Neogobius melanostomus TaxID=47308 RepID=A0A8C6WF82_9GOBI
MQTYSVKVFTGYSLLNILDIIYVKLVGKDGESDWTWFSALSGGVTNVSFFQESTLTLTCEESLGDLTSVDLQKQWRPWPLQRQGFVEKVEVTSSEEKVFKFPIYHWMKRTKVYSFCEGKGKSYNVTISCASSSWKVYKEGLPECIDADKVSDLLSEVQFSSTKNNTFFFAAFLKYRMCLLLLAVFLEYVKQHWKEDAFFGYQFLNGVNPMMIRRCDSLPENFPVTDDMVTLEGNGKNGNIFLCDYKSVDGMDTDKINNKVQYLAAPLVLFHKTPADELKPVAIQLKQIPAEDNPIFVSSDSEYDWLLAKIFVRSAEFNEYQLNSHLLLTHLLAEVFAVALLRNMPKVHPLYKLLIPHTRFTLHINLLGRKRLISEDGSFPLFTAASAEGMAKFMQRSHSAVTYESLCIKDDIKERGLESVPNFYYRDDGFKLWDIIEKFVKGVLTYYYKKDEEIKRDTELQEYIKSIFEHGFGSREETGELKSTVDELVKFVTMVIFTSSAQHAAFNNGMAEYGSWMPNTPTSLQKPPPTKKGTVTEQTSCFKNVVRSLTCQTLSSQVALGRFPHEHFTEEVPCRLMRQFRAELDKLDKEIDDKNKKRKLPYMYLKPTLMENSAAS